MLAKIQELDKLEWNQHELFLQSINNLRGIVAFRLNNYQFIEQERAKFERVLEKVKIADFDEQQFSCVLKYEEGEGLHFRVEYFFSQSVKKQGGNKKSTKQQQSSATKKQIKESKNVPQTQRKNEQVIYIVPWGQQVSQEEMMEGGLDYFFEEELTFNIFSPESIYYFSAIVKRDMEQTQMAQTMYNLPSLNHFSQISIHDHFARVCRLKKGESVYVTQLILSGYMNLIKAVY